MTAEARPNSAVNVGGDNSRFEWPARMTERTIPPFARLVSWSFIADGDLDFEQHEEHAFAVWLGNDLWSCAGCLSRSWRHFNRPEPGFPNGHPGWPSMDHAPNGTQVVLAHVSDIAFPHKVHGRPACPLRPMKEATDVR